MTIVFTDIGASVCADAPTFDPRTAGPIRFAANGGRGFGV